MGNPCGYGNCKEAHCIKCPCFKPTICDVRVPKWIGIIGFNIEAWITYEILKNKRF